MKNKITIEFYNVSKNLKIYLEKLTKDSVHKLAFSISFSVIMPKYFSSNLFTFLRGIERQKRVYHRI